MERLEDAMSQLDVLLYDKSTERTFLQRRSYIRLKDFYILTKEKDGTCEG